MNRREAMVVGGASLAGLVISSKVNATPAQSSQQLCGWMLKINYDGLEHPMYNFYEEGRLHEYTTGELFTARQYAEIVVKHYMSVVGHPNFYPVRDYEIFPVYKDAVAVSTEPKLEWKYQYYDASKTHEYDLYKDGKFMGWVKVGDEWFNVYYMRADDMTARRSELSLVGTIKMMQVESV